MESQVKGDALQVADIEEYIVKEGEIYVEDFMTEEDEHIKRKPIDYEE